MDIKGDCKRNKIIYNRVKLWRKNMEKKERLKLIKEITEVDGISGHERNASRVMKKYLEGNVDEITYDNIGSIIGKKVGTDDVKIMIAGHIDEIGFMVSKIDDKGYISMHPIGGWWGHVVLGQRFHVINREGKKFVGVVGSPAPHGMSPEERVKVKEVKSMFLDLGVANKEEVEALGIRVGDPIIPISEFTVMNNENYWLGKAFDDRLGAAIAIETVRNLKGIKHPNTVYAVGTVQEEVGLRGAKTAAYAVKPDLAIAIDVTVATDYPTGKNECKLGDGVAISYADSSVIGHKAFIELLEEIAKEEKIPYCFDMMVGGGTDSGEIHKSFEGVVTVTLSLPTRYIHAHNGIVHAGDYDATVRLITALCKRFDRNMLNQLIKSKQ